MSRQASAIDSHSASNGQASRLPDTYLLIAGVAIVVFLLSFFLTPGQFEVSEQVRSDGSEFTLIDPSSFRYADGEHGAVLFSSDAERPGLFNSVFEGLASGSRTGGAVGIMTFILLVGGAFGVVMATGALDRALRRLISNESTDARLLLAGLFVAFSLGGAVFGMGEETIPFVLLLVPVLARLGYDSVTGVLVTFAATQVGFASSWMNPFNVAIAQGIAELPLLSGMPLRIVMWFVFTAFGLFFTVSYAQRMRSTPALADSTRIDSVKVALSKGDWLMLATLLLTILWIVWGVIRLGYYLPEIATQFFVLGTAAVVIGCIFNLNGMTPNSAMESFRKGAQALLPAALIVGFARGIVYLMGGDDPASPSLLNTLLHHGSESLGGLPAWLAAWLMFAGQSVFNFFVTSGSGQAALTMPIMAPLSDLLGVTRQVAVLAFQLGDGLSNALVPTSAALMGCLGAAQVQWLDWVRKTAWFFVGLFVLASIFVLAGVMTGFS
jgi:uncharacterized ion transporter superfamily protein YfcC